MFASTHRQHVAALLSVASGSRLEPSQHPLPPSADPHRPAPCLRMRLPSSTCCGDRAGLRVRLALLEEKKRRSRIRLRYRRAKRSDERRRLLPPAERDPSAGSRSISANQPPRAAVTQGNGTSGETFHNKSVTCSTMLEVAGMLNFIRALKV